MRRVLVVGQGYVGLPLAIAAVEAGFDVIGLEEDESKVAGLLEGSSHVEDIDNERLAAAMETGRFAVVVDPDEVTQFDVAVISVPTPLSNGQPDLRHVREAGDTVSRLLRPGNTVVLESTTWPGTTKELLLPILEHGSGLCAGKDFYLGYSPERIDPGNKIWNLENTPKVVSGVDDESLDAVDNFYSAFVNTTVRVPGCGEAELTKLLENTFRHVNIALINELSMYARDLGVDIWSTLEAASTKPFGFMPFYPGPGVGGHCLPIDPTYLQWKVNERLGQSFRFVELANEVNGHMPAYVLRRLEAGMRSRGLELAGSNVVVLGFAYKKNTGDARETPARPVVEMLIEAGARVAVADPHVSSEHWPDGVDRVTLSKELLTQADACVVLVGHDSFDPQVVEGLNTYILDTCNWLGAAAGVELL